MAKNKYNNFIKSYDTIRDTLRTIFLYGSFSREDFALKKISGRKYDKEKRRILNFLRDDVIDDFNYPGNSKVVRIVYNKYEQIGNFLADSFLTKTFNRNDVIQYFLIQQVLTSVDSFLDVQEILSTITEHLPEGEDMDISTVRRKLTQMAEEGLIEIHWDKNKKLFGLAEDLFRDLSDKELEQLAVAVNFFRNTSAINLPGYYLSDTLKRYLHYERNMEVSDEDLFTYKHNHLQRIIDDEVLFSVFEGVYEQRKLEFHYHGDKKSKVVIPLKLIIEYYYGRQYLYALNTETKKLTLYRLDRIKKIRLGEKYHLEDIPKDILDVVEVYLEKSWCATLLQFEQGVTEVQVKINIDEKSQGFIINRLMKEGRWGKVHHVDQGKYVFTIEVNDPTEMIPWLRSFAGYATVQDSDHHSVRDLLLTDAKGPSKIMELYNEHKNRYLRCIEKIINDSVAGAMYRGIDLQRLLIKERILKKNHKNVFENLDLKEALLNECQEEDDKQNLYLFRKTEEDYFKPVIDRKISIRPQLCEKQWLQMVLEHPKAVLFFDDALIQKLKDKLQGIGPIYNQDIVIEKNKDLSDDQIESESFRRVFRTLLQAIYEKKLVKYTSQAKSGKLFHDKVTFPYRIKFSPRNNKFRLSTYSINEERPVLINVSSIQVVEILDESMDELQKKALAAIMSKKAETPLVLEVKNKNKAVERCFAMFSFYEKDSTYDRETDRHLLEVYYYQFDEKEIIRDILTLGSSVTVLKPEHIRDEIIDRLKKAVEQLKMSKRESTVELL